MHFVLSLVFEFSVGIGFFCHKTESDLLSFSISKIVKTETQFNFPYFARIKEQASDKHHLCGNQSVCLQHKITLDNLYILVCSCQW